MKATLSLSALLALVTSFSLSGDVVRTVGISDRAWAESKWISTPGIPKRTEAEGKGWLSAAGADCFRSAVTNRMAVRRARWRTSGHGVYEAYVNGHCVGSDFLKPGYTHARKTRYSFEYDVTSLLRRGKGDVNTLSAIVTAGWWRDCICGYPGKASAFRGLLEIEYADGSRSRYGTNCETWEAKRGGPVLRAGIYDGESYDARLRNWVAEGDYVRPVPNEEFQGEVLPSIGAEVTLRNDLALKPCEAYVWREAANATDKSFGRVIKLRNYKTGDSIVLAPGETLVVDFGQNASFIPDFEISAPRGTVLTCLPGEALNDANGEKSRGNDGPAGSVYRANLRIPNTGCKLFYTCAGGGFEHYQPRFTFFGYRYISFTATGNVLLRKLVSIPVTSIRKEDEIGTLVTGDAGVNRLIANAYWGQLSNYLSLPTDCPQRNERQGWLADTQVFTETGAYNADVRRFFAKWMRDVRDTQAPSGGFPGIAPHLGVGENGSLRLGWSDAGVIVPYRIWRQFGDTSIVRDHWEAMTRYVALAAKTKFDYEVSKPYNEGFQWADWLSFEPYESFARAYANNWNIHFAKPPEMTRYWSYLGACYWLDDAKMMSEMATALGKAEESAKYAKMAEEARAYLKATFFGAEDVLQKPFCDMQTPNLFALHCGLVEGAGREKTIAKLKANFAAHGVKS